MRTLDLPDRAPSYLERLGAELDRASRYDRRGDKARRAVAERLSLDLGVAPQPPSEHDSGPKSQGDAR